MNMDEPARPPPSSGRLPDVTSGGRCAKCGAELTVGTGGRCPACLLELALEGPEPLELERLGPYEVLSRLGTGGMGVVYRARDSRLDRDVASKVLPGVVGRDPERIARCGRRA